MYIPKPHRDRAGRTTLKRYTLVSLVAPFGHRGFMPYTPERIAEIAAIVRGGESPNGYTPRDLIGWFSAARRGRHVVALVRRYLRDAGIATKPDFEYAYIDEPLTFVVDGGEPTAPPSTTAIPEPADPILAAAAADPIYRIGRLDSANTTPVSVVPQSTVAQAITIMLYNDFSQLPVIHGQRELRGAVSWRSIGRKLALGQTCATVMDCAEEATAISSDTSLFSALPLIVEKEYVFVRDRTNRIAGIVTTSDLSLQFRQLAEPFLLLGEIENQLRRLSAGKFTLSEIVAVRDPADALREITDLSDLTFGEHLRLLENPDRWNALGLPVDRATFVGHLRDVRDIRNGVMHFDPDGVDPEELGRLRNFARLLGSLA
jgi:CBS domain-containing protein